MIAEFRGVYDMNFPDGKGGTIDGISLQLVYENPSVIGHMTKGKFIQRDFCVQKGWTKESLKPLVGKIVDLEVDLKGHVLGIKVTDKTSINS